jgi:hypothetical protein
MGVYQLRPGVFQITTQGVSSATLAIMGSSSEPFNKTFHSYITVEAQDNGLSEFKGRAQINTQLNISGSLHLTNDLLITASISLQNNPDRQTVLLVNTTSGSVTLTLPQAASSLASNRIYFIKKVGGTNTLTIDPAGTSRIDAATTLSTNDASASLQLWSSGNNTTGYYIMSAYGTWT